MATKTLYEVLGVPEDASEEEIKAVFKKLAKRFHPDVATLNKKEAEGAFKEIAAAYTVLSNRSKRRVYDQGIKYGGFPEKPALRYEWNYQPYLDAYAWSPLHPGEWNEHHDVMYG